ncbi:helix-turn-helix domain-containing protein [uncultured Flavobacterium sp.]|uniref:AraC family transcriptional regulator n=1 Tax=uncultured Flavobacterium sp. TaxID=165435 RepID=UPI003081651A
MAYEKLTLKEKQFFLAKFESILVSKKLFLKKDFSLPELAIESGIPLHTISYLLNSEVNLHFTDYINLKRIEYFKEKINDADWNNLPLKEMILASGFQSRVTCHRAFLKHVGITPSEYLKSNRIVLKEKQFFLAKFESILVSKKLFLKKDFSLQEFAAESEIPLHTISYAFNSQINLHFKDYINLLRIEYFKEKINDPDWKDLTLQKMILASGFQCRTTCYRAFKKHIGITPSKYLTLTRIVPILLGIIALFDFILLH